MEEPIIGRAAEEALGFDHARAGLGIELISSCPGSPAATQAPQRHRLTGRQAVF